MAQPFIFHRSVLNAASFAPQAAPNGSIPRGSIFSVFGRNLGPASPVGVSAFPLQTTLGGVSIEVCQGATCVAAIPLFVSAGQVNAILPSNAPLGPVSVRVTHDGAAGNFSPAEVVESGFGTFSVSSAGFGPGVVQNFVDQGVTPLNSAEATARPGQTVILWGTGLGAALGPDNVAPQAGDLPVEVEIWVGGVPVTVKRYSGRTPCCAGVDQIVFDIPATAPTGCYVPVTLRTGGVVSNTTTIAITAEGQGTCSDPFSPLSAARAGGRVGLVLMERVRWQLAPFLPLVVTSDGFGGLLQNEPAGPWHFNRLYSLPPPGSCAGYTFNTGEISVEWLAALPASGSAISAGEALTVDAPGREEPVGRNMRLNGFYTGLLGTSLTLEPPLPLIWGESETTRVSAPGGPDVAAFAVDIPAPPRLTWTNREAAQALRRGQPTTVSWTGGDPDGLMVIAGLSNNEVNLASAAFVCTERTAAGTFTIPGYMTGALLAPGPGLTPGGLALGAMRPAAASFSADGLDVGLGVFLAVEEEAFDVP